MTPPIGSICAGARGREVWASHRHIHTSHLTQVYDVVWRYDRDAWRDEAVTRVTLEIALENAKRARAAAVFAARAAWRSSAAGASIMPASAVAARKIVTGHPGRGVRGRAARAVPRQCSTWIAPFWGRPIDGSAAFKTASHVIDCYALIGNSAARAVAGPRPGQHPGNFGLPIGPSGPISGPCMRAGRSAGLRRRPVALRRSWRGWRAIGGR